MGERSSYPEGVPSWVDLMTSDPAAARDFYGRVLGWSYEISDDPMTGHYAQALLDGRRVAGMAGDPAPDGAPLVWTTYFAVDDADKTAARIREHGGAVLMEPTDVGNSGRMAIGVDPTGAAFGLWQAGAHAGAQLVNVPGAVVWNELHTPDPDAASTFYAGVFGHDYDDMDMGGGQRYRMFKVGGKVAAGMMPADPAGGTPPYWLVYFDVADVDATVATAAEAGGAVLAPPTDTGAGRIAVLQDPQGVAFAVITSVRADD
jgi:predicted enzyme related to lactoylglutathione lyase